MQTGESRYLHILLSEVFQVPSRHGGKKGQTVQLYMGGVRKHHLKIKKNIFFYNLAIKPFLMSLLQALFDCSSL